MFTLNYDDLPQHIIDDCDDIALESGALLPWNLDVPCQAFVPQDWQPVTSTTRYARAEPPTHPTY